MAPPVAKTSAAEKGNDSAPSLENRVQSTLNDSAVFGDKLSAYRDPAQRANYTALSSTLMHLRNYLAGNSTYEQFQSRMKMWSASATYGDAVNQKARANLLAILQGVKDPELKEKASTAAIAIRANTKEISSSAPAPAATPKDAGPSKDPAPTPKAAELAAPPKAAPKNVVSYDFQKARSAKEEQDQFLTDAALGWSAESRKKYPAASLGIMRVRDFIAGRTYDPSAVRDALVGWRMNESFNKDPVLKATYTKLISALGSMKADQNVKPAQTAGALMNEVNASVTAIEPKPAAAAPKPEAPKKPEAAPKAEAPKKPEPAPKPATPPPAPKPTSPPPAPPKPAPAPPAPKLAPVVPVVPPAAVAKASESLSDEAIFGNKIGEWNESSVKGGSHLALNSSILTLREFVDGKSTYVTLKDRLAKWEGSSAYNTALSETARTNLISILKGMTSGPHADKAKSALIAINGTKEISVPKPAIPAKPVAVASLEVVPNSKPLEGTITEEQFKELRLDIAKRQHVQSSKATGKVFNVLMDVYVTVKPDTGEISKVTYKNVSAVRAGDKGENVTQGEVEGFMKDLAGAYRSEVRFVKGGKTMFAYRLDLKEAPGAIPSLPPPGPIAKADQPAAPAIVSKPKAKAETPVTPPPAKTTGAGSVFPPPPAPPAAPPPLKAGGSVITTPSAPPVAPPAPALKKDGVMIPPPPPLAPPPPLPTGSTKSSVKSTYTFNLNDQPLPNLGPQSQDGVVQAFQNAGKRAATSFGKRGGEGFLVNVAVKVTFDTKGFVEKVEFTQVDPKQGIASHEQMQDLLSRFARNLRASMRGEAKGGVDVKKAILTAA